ncbi:MAG: hypothetical protein ABI268_05945 [Rhodanobacter sp.]
MQKVEPIEDFPERSYDIPSGGNLTGQIALDRYFLDLAKVKDARDFVVFWVYQPPGEKGVPIGKKFGGMIPLDSEGIVRHENFCPPKV